VHDERLGDDRGHVHARIQRRVRILKNDLHVAPHPAHVAGAESEDILTFEFDAARGRLDQSQDAAADGGLARSRLANETERLSAADSEADAVNGFDLRHDARENAAFHRKVLLQIAHDEERFADTCGEHRRFLARGWIDGHVRASPSESEC